MQKKLRLSETQLVSIIKKVLTEQATMNPQVRKKFLETAWCSLKFGQITNGGWKGRQWCGPNGFMKKYAVTDDEIVELEKKCPYVYTMPNKNQEKIDGWNDIYKYFSEGKDGTKRTSHVMEGSVCDDSYYWFTGEKDGRKVSIYSDGDYIEFTPSSRSLNGKWSWDGTKPVFNLPFTRKGVALAQTEDDITTNQKILTVGSQGDLVKRVQYEILWYSRGQINPGCKKDSDGKFKPKTCDGIFGPNTKKGVIDFQKEEGLRDKSGIVGAETWDAMNPESIDALGVAQEELDS